MMMRNARIFSLLLVAGCGAAPRPTPVTVATPTVPIAPIDLRPPKIDAPHDLVAWMHVEHPRELGALIERVNGPADKDASCAKGNVRACLELIDAERPIDLAAVPVGSDDVAEAFGFSVRGLDAFRTEASRSFEVTELRSGRLQLLSGASGKKFECDVGRAKLPDHRVVCGEAPGLERLGGWLASSPAPASRDGLARIDIYRGPLVAAADTHWKDGDARALAHDFDGATITLTGSDDPSARAELALDVRMREAKSAWTRALLAPSSDSPLPATFGRLAPDSTGTLYVPGGTALVALLDRAGAFDDLTARDPAKAKPVVDELRATLGRPMACGYVVDLDDGRAAMAKAKAASGKDLEKAHAELDAALSGHVTCAFQAPAKSIEKLARKVVALMPPSGDRYAVRAATGLGLPAGSFALETKHAAKPGKPASTDTTFGVPDGDTTWIVMANNASDLGRTTRAIKRVLSRPATGTNAIALAPPGTLLLGDATTLLGAFFWDLAMHSYDAVEKTLATTTTPPQHLQLALSRRAEGAGGTISLHLSTDVSALPIFGARAAAIAMPLGIFAALLFTESSSKPSATP